MSQSSTKGSICWKYIPWYHIVASSKWSNFVVNWYFLVFPTKKSRVQILSFIVVIIDLKTIYIYIYINKNYSLFLSSLLIVFFSIHFPLKVQEDLFLWKGFLLTFWSLFFGWGINFIIWIVGNLRKKLISRQLKNLISSDSSYRAQLESIQSKWFSFNFW